MKWFLIVLLSYLNFANCQKPLSKKTISYDYDNVDPEQDDSDVYRIPFRHDESVVPVQAVEQTGQNQNIQLIQQSQPTQPSQPSQPSQPIQPIQSSQPSQPIQPIQSSQPSQQSQPSVPSQPIQTSFDATKVPTEELSQQRPLVLSNASNVLGSVREYPSEIHRCSASFIKHDILLTTARCIYGRDSSNTYVHALSEFLILGGATYGVKELVTHPNFEASPPINDVGIIILYHKVARAPIFKLPTPELDTKGDSVKIYGWKFSYDKKHYFLQHSEAGIISSAKCSLILNEYVDCEFICAGETVIELGSFDQGVPLTLHKGNQSYIMGIYNREGLDRKVMAEKYSKVLPHTQWIKYVMAEKGANDTIEMMRRYNMRKGNLGRYKKLN